MTSSGQEKSLANKKLSLTLKAILIAVGFSWGFSGCVSDDTTKPAISGCDYPQETYTAEQQKKAAKELAFLERAFPRSQTGQMIANYGKEREWCRGASDGR
jgi:hypothetical protein